MTGAPPPFELIEAWIVEAWHIPPSVLAREPADKVLQYWQLLREYEKYFNKRPKGLREI